jgi:hypothetical protein
VVHLNLIGYGVPYEASTVVLNVTVTGAKEPGHISVYPAGVPRPTVSSVNFTAGWTGANSVTVKIGANGTFDLYNGGSATHVIVDVFGYYSVGRACCVMYGGTMGGQYHSAGATVPNFAIVPAIPCNQRGSATGWPSIGVYTSNSSHIIIDIVGYYDDGSLPDGLRFEPVVPTRIADTRSGQGWPSALGPQTTALIAAPAAVTGVDAWALAINVTAVVPSHDTFLTVWPADLPGVGQPGTSNLNPSAGSFVPNAVQTMIGLENEFNVYNNAGTCHVVIDVVGRFVQHPPSPPPGWESMSPSALAQYFSAAGSRRSNSAPTPTVSPAQVLIKSL